jgi:DNA invertase Pin-like site-specific DNA recombinase
MPRVKGANLSLVGKIDYSNLQHILVPYRRVSTREQADKGAGLDAQRTGLTFGLQLKEATALTWDCVDRGKSGKSLKRDGLDQTLKLIRAGEAGGLIVSKLDRLSRSLLDFAYLMTTADKEGWNIVALDLGVDLSTPSGKAMAGMLAVFAEFERNVISQRTKDGLAEKRDQGVRLGRPVEIQLPLLDFIVAQYLETQNYSEVARRLNESGTPTVQGGKQWYPMVVSKLVASPAGRESLERYEEAA